ncbi:MAG TPA: alcohol dehydrogenase [Phycisphaerales bacterium]|nr:alcohol dehydrogenase [Phycisphaerales bacterium]
MKSKRIIFDAPFSVQLQDEQIALDPLPEHGVALQTRYTLISAGTDIACLSGMESWFKLPGTPGYTAVSQVVGVGSAVRNLTPGDRVYHFGSNRQYQVVSDSELLLKLPENIDERLVPFTRLATIAMTAIRVVPVELGDTVAVTGLGLVGNFAVQLAKLSGAKVIGIDPSPARRALAKQCGADVVLDPTNGSAVQEVLRRTDQQGVHALIEASGMSRVLADSLPMVARYGQAVLLGSPRAEFVTDITPLYRQSHVGRCVTIKGASEWRLPVKMDAHVKHSIERNSQIVLDLMAQDKLMVEPLLTHTFYPEQAAEAYHGVRMDKDQYMGVVFDWCTQAAPVGHEQGTEK